MFVCLKEVQPFKISPFILYLDLTFLDDLSFGKLATQSRIYHWLHAINAVDRNMTTCMRTGPIGISSPDKKMWWKVDLGRVYSIDSINIWFQANDYYGMCICK